MRSAALLRAINVGGRNSVRMADLKDCFERAGYSDVATHLQSGNVLFSHARPVDCRTIEAMLEARFGFSILVILRSKAELGEALDAAPFDPADEDLSHQFITFFAEPFEGDLPADPPKGGCAYLKKTRREVYSRWWKVDGRYEVPPSPKSFRTGTTRNFKVSRDLFEKL